MLSPHNLKGVLLGQTIPQGSDPHPSTPPVPGKRHCVLSQSSVLETGPLAPVSGTCAHSPALLPALLPGLGLLTLHPHPWDLGSPLTPQPPQPGFLTPGASAALSPCTYTSRFSGAPLPCAPIHGTLTLHPHLCEPQQSLHLMPKLLRTLADLSPLTIPFLGHHPPVTQTHHPYSWDPGNPSTP